jgi:predicted esterase
MAAGVPYVALPPTAVDVEPADSPPLIMAWHGRRPPCTHLAFAAAVPLTGIPGWRVYLGLPDIRDDSDDSDDTVIEQAAARLPVTIEELREELGLETGPVGLAGFSVGACVALRGLARGDVFIAAAALIAPLTAGRAWVDDIAASDPALLLVGGGNDAIVPPADLVELRDLLRTAGASDVELATFRMGHALTAEPGIEARPQIAEAISVDAAITDWFRDRLDIRPRRPVDPSPPLHHTVPHGIERESATAR